MKLTKPDSNIMARVTDMKKNKVKYNRVLMFSTFLLIVLITAACSKQATPSKEMATETEMDEPMATEASTDKEMATESTMKVEAMMTNEGDLAPDFEFVDAEGNIYTNDTFKGQKVYLKYWASWCPICLDGLADFDSLSAESHDYVVYSVVTPNANGEQSQADFIQWFNGLDKKNMKVLFDMKGQAAREFGVRAFPTSIFIGSDGVLIEAAPGHKTNEAIDAMMQTFN